MGNKVYTCIPSELQEREAHLECIVLELSNCTSIVDLVDYWSRPENKCITESPDEVQHLCRACMKLTLPALYINEVSIARASFLLGHFLMQCLVSLMQFQSCASTRYLLIILANNLIHRCREGKRYPT